MAKKQGINLLKHNPLEPIDYTKLGSNEDCFGLNYDLSTKECKQCGDSELCALKMSQLLGKTRKQLEEENHYKDLDVLEDVSAIKKFIRRLKRQGKQRKEIIKEASIKFEVPVTDLRKIYKEVQTTKTK